VADPSLAAMVETLSNFAVLAPRLLRCCTKVAFCALRSSAASSRSTSSCISWSSATLSETSANILCSGFALGRQTRSF
jgi:hypothetical protein